MNARIISVDTKVNIELKTSSGQTVNCKGEFKRIVNDSEVIVVSKDLLPLGYSKLTLVTGVFPHIWHGMLKFSGVLLKKDELKGDTILHIKIHEFERIQKRGYYRPTCNFDAMYRKRFDLNNEYKPAKTKDLSFAGLCLQFIKNEIISDKDLIDVKVTLKANLEINVSCKVLRISEFMHNNKNYYELGMSIESISQEDKEILKEYISANAVVDSVYWKEID